MYSCNFCDYQVYQKGQLTRHKLTVHNNKPKFACRHCSFETSYENSLMNHLVAKHDHHDESVVCPICDFRASSKGNLRKHMGVVHYTWKGVRGDYDYKTSLEVTVGSRAHEVREFFACRACDYGSSDLGTLCQHIKDVHQWRKDFACRLCVYKASNSENLKKHIARVHEVRKDFTSVELILDSYMEVVNKVKDCFTCDLCNLKVTSKSHLLIHKRAVHPNGLSKYECHTCSFKTSHKSALRSHVTTHSKSKVPYTLVQL